MPQMILQTSTMALELAKILFGETQPTMKLEWFTPLRVEEEDDLWSLSGRVDQNRKLPPGALDDQLENPIFHMHVVKADSEVKDVGISVGMKLPPEAKAQIRAQLEGEGITWSDLQAHQPQSYAPEIWLNTALHGGIINSKEAAIQFGELIFESHFSLQRSKIQNLRTELLDGIWHLTGVANKQSAELVFRRSNAQVISLDLRPI